MRLRHDLAREMQPFAQVGESFIGQGVVVPLPRELGLDVTFGSEGLHGLDHFEVADGGDVGVGWAVEVFGSDQDTFFEERFVDLGAAVSERGGSVGRGIRHDGSAWR